MDQPKPSLRRIYARVPNSTFHTLRYPFYPMAIFYRIQWPMI